MWDDASSFTNVVVNKLFKFTKRGMMGTFDEQTRYPTLRKREVGQVGTM